MKDKRRKSSRSLRQPLKVRERPYSDDDSGAGRRRWGVWILLPVLLLSVLAAYYPAWHGKMLWDDDRHITRPDLRSTQGMWRIWFELGATQQYYPLMHSAFWFQHKLWGDNTLWYHLVNILLHAFSAFLLALLLRRLAIPGAYLAAVIFALHPVHVESVAWITELKNTLSAVLFLGAALTYLNFDRSRERRWYAPAFLLFILALMTKTVTATLPAALLVTFWWQRGKLEWRRDVMPLAPWFALGAGAGILTAWVEQTLVGAQGAAYNFTLIERILIAGRVVWFYLGKLVWPANLTFIYPRWQVSQGIWWQYLFPIGLAALLLMLWWMRKHSRAPLAVMLLFGGLLFPVLGFFNVYPFRYSFVADHFQYLASIAIITLFASCVTLLVRRWQARSAPVEIVIMLLFGCLLAVPTWSQSRQYADGETLYRTTLRRNPTCWMAYNNLGNILQGRGQAKEAVDYYREAVKLKPDYAEAYNNLGDAWHSLGQLDEAEASYREAIRFQPSLAGAHYNLGNTLQEAGRFEEAAASYREAIRLKPDLPEAHGNLGTALERLGRVDEAVEHLQEAVRLRPGYALAVYNLGNALQRMGRLQEAASRYEEALRINPGFAEAVNGLGQILQRMGRFEEAEARYRDALRLKPDFVQARVNLGNAYQTQGRLTDAVAEYEAAQRIDPGFAGTYFNLGNALQEMNRPQDAVTQYREAVRLEPNFSEAHYNLGLALQRLGRHNEAVLQYRQVVSLAPDFAEAHNALGAALAMTGKLEEAARHFQEAVRLRPDYAEAQANLARALAMIKKIPLFNDPVS